MDDQVRVLRERVMRLEDIVLSMAVWLVQAQTGFGAKDYRGLEKLIADSRTKASDEASA